MHALDASIAAGSASACVSQELLVVGKTSAPAVVTTSPRMTPYRTGTPAMQAADVSVYAD